MSRVVSPGGSESALAGQRSGFLRPGLTVCRTTLATFLLSLPLAPCVVGDEASEALPLEPERQLIFETAEATWPALDLSPDGRTILFDVLGDIYAVPRTGGQAVPVLAGIPFESQPVFSPDGSLFAFVSDRSGSENLWIADADGSNPRRLSHDDDGVAIFTAPAWSPDGRYVYVSRMVHSVLAFEVFMFHVDGGSGIRLTNARPTGNESFEERHNALGVTAAPNGRELLYATKAGSTWTNRNEPHWSIARRDLQTGAEAIVVAPAAGAMRPVLDHRGERLVYASRHGAETGLRTRNLATGEDRWLLYPVDHDSRGGGYYSDLLPRFAFAPDDDAIVLSLQGQLHELDLTSGALSPIPVTVPVNLGVGPQLRFDQPVAEGPVRVRVIQSPRLSPDGTTVVFSALGGLYRADLESGAAPARFEKVSRPAFQPSWSPDGRSIVFVSWSTADGGQVWIVDGAGRRRPEQVTRIPAFYTSPVFTSDGAAIVVLRANHHDRLRAPDELQPHRPTDIVRIHLGTGEETLVTRAAGARDLQSSADGGSVRYQDEAGVFGLRLDGAGRRPLLQVKSRAASQYVEGSLPADAIRLSPTGEWALVRAAAQLHLVAVPPANGTEPPLVDLGSPSVAHRQLTRVGADDFAWADGGRVISWSLGSTLYRLPFDAIRFDDGAEPAQLAEAFELPVNATRDTPRGTLLLRGATAITMRGDEVIENADVLIDGNRIAGIGPAGTVTIPAGTEVREVTGRYVIPGLVDTHAHWFQIRRNLPEPGHWNFLAYLAYGVTAGLDVQTFTTDAFVYQDMIDAGMMPGPRAWSTGPGIFRNSEIHSEQDAVDVMLRYRDHYRTRNLKAYMVGDRRQRQWVARAAHTLGMMPTTEGASDLRLNLTHAIDGFAGNEHALPITPLHDDVIQLYAGTRIGYTPTLSVLYGGMPSLDRFMILEHPRSNAKLCRFVPYAFIEAKTRNPHYVYPEEQTVARFAEDAWRIRQAGGLVGIGSHGEMPGIGYHWEMWTYAEGGAPPHAVLQAATIDSATIIGRASSIGSLEAGKLADLLVLGADPLENIRNSAQIDFVMKNGRLYDGDTLDESWPEARPLKPRWFWSDGPDSRLPCAAAPDGNRPKPGE